MTTAGGERVALITGVTGQDGAYLTALLLARGYRVVGGYRRRSSDGFWRLAALQLLDHPRLRLLPFDVTDPGAAQRVIAKVRPHEVYNLAAMSFVATSFHEPIATAATDALGPVHLLEAIRRIDPSIRFYQASTSEMFGAVAETPQRESTPFHPRSPYAAAKLYAHWMTVNQREQGLYAASGILFNHESPLRGEEFVTRKVTIAVARIAAGKQESVALGNLSAERDWGYAPDYVEGMWRMLQHDTPETFVLATGRSASVREFTAMAFAAAGITLAFEGEGEQEIGVDAASGAVRVRVDPAFYRPTEVEFLLGDAARARALLGWSAATPLEVICSRMVEADLERQRR
jgi:GDPmannose 4,6-dehydratase